MFKDKAESRRRNFKKGIDVDESRRRREESAIELRKNKREEQLQKRRNFQTQDVPDNTIFDDQEILQKIALIPQFVATLASSNYQDVIEATTQLRKLLSIEKNPPIKQVIAAGAVPFFVSFLARNEYQSLQFEAAWALTNIASGSSEDTQVVVLSGAVPLFIQLLSSPYEDVKEQAVWALGNIAGDGAAYRDLILQSGGLRALLPLCRPKTRETLLRNATWTLSNFCRGKPQPDFELVSPALGVLSQLLHEKDQDVLADTCWALSYLSDDNDDDNNKIEAVVQSGVVRRLVELLMHNSNTIKTPALRTIGNIVTGSDAQTNTVIHCGALPCLLSLLNHPKKGIKKEACWTLSNITAGSGEQVEYVKRENIFPVLIKLVLDGEFEIKKEAAWAISNATSSGTADHVKYLVQHGVIPPLCKLLDCDDAKTTIVALEALENILKVGRDEALRLAEIKQMPFENKYCAFVEECDGLAQIENLQEHDNEEVYKRAQAILQEFWEIQEEQSNQPEATESGYSFGTGVPSGGFAF